MTNSAANTSNAAENCSLCGGGAPRLMEAHGRCFHQCPRCDLIFVPRCWHLSADAEKARYATHQNTLDNAGYVARFEVLINLVSTHCAGVRRVLDYGSGPGPVLVELLRRRGYEASGYDPYFAPETDLSLPFDAVVSTETFEHFATPGQAMARILGLIRRGGYLAVMTEFHQGPSAFADWYYPRDPTHVAFYSPRTFVYFCEAFELVQTCRNERNIVILQKVGG